ncbi:MAG: hypothetical protein BWY76_03213 [bacterium ADurb.Bin429]|nr:MAG: hypothetical protein BWY76_03213 [bacterium ADurb.Bin429]
MPEGGRRFAPVDELADIPPADAAGAHAHQRLPRPGFDLALAQADGAGLGFKHGVGGMHMNDSLLLLKGACNAGMT